MFDRPGVAEALRRPHILGIPYFRDFTFVVMFIIQPQAVKIFVGAREGRYQMQSRNKKCFVPF